MKGIGTKQIIASLLISLSVANFAGALEPARTTAPTGPYHVGRLSFTTPGGQAVDLSIQFRDGRALASHVLVDGKLYSPSGINQHGMAPHRALDNVEGLRFDGTELQGDWKWVPRGSVETLTFGATVRDGLVTGKAGQAELTGWLRLVEPLLTGHEDLLLVGHGATVNQLTQVFTRRAGRGDLGDWFDAWNAQLTTLAVEPGTVKLVRLGDVSGMTRPDCICICPNDFLYSVGATK